MGTPYSQPKNGLDKQDHLKLPEVISALKSKGLLKGTEAKLANTFPKIRDHAFHANWDLVTSIDVGSVINFVEKFLLQHFS